LVSQPGGLQLVLAVIGKKPPGYRNSTSRGTNRFMPFLVSCESKTIEQNILEANSRSDGQEMPCLVCNQTVDLPKKVTVKRTIVKAMTAVVMKSI
jgi:hypothetical protein